MNTYLGPAADADAGDPNRWVILGILCGSLVLVVVSVSSLNVAIPPIQRSLDASGRGARRLVAAIQGRRRFGHERHDA